MLPDPLHPAVVHFPVVLAVLLPLFVIGGIWAVRRGARPSRAWALPLVVALLVTGSAWLALETGEAQEERVEDVVGEEALHEHEEAAERFLVLAAVVTAVAVGGLAGGSLGTAARFLTALGSIAVLATGAQTGDLGGELVYRHGAASAYLDADVAGSEAGGAVERTEAHRPQERLDSVSPSRVALPGLFSVMAGLQAEMGRVSQGVWAGDLGTVAAGAAAIADHPRAPQAERARIAEALGQDVARFQELDQKVHDTAVRLRDLARAGDLEGALAAEAELRSGCVACHEAFRQPLRDALGDDGG